MEQRKYLQCKVSAWKKKTKNDNDYFSLAIEVTDDILQEMVKTKNNKLNANIFFNKKTKEGQPDFVTIESKKEN